MDRYKQPAEFVKTLLEAAGSAFRTLLGISTAMGFLALFLHCYFVAGYFPSGLTIGDSALLLMIALGVGTLGVLLCLLGALPFLPFAILSHFPGGSLTGDGLSADQSLETSKNFRGHEAPPAKPMFLDLIWIPLSLAIGILFAWSLYFFIYTLNPQSGDVPRYPGLLEVPGAYVAMFALAGLMAFLFAWVMVRVRKSAFAVACLVVSATALIEFIWAYVALLVAVESGRGFIPLLGMIVPGILATMVYSQRAQLRHLWNWRAHEKRQQAWGMLSLLLLLPLLAILMSDYLGTSTFSKGVMGNLGIYADRTAGWVNDRNLRLVEEASEISGIPISACREPDGSALLTNLRVLWHSIGSRSIVQLRRIPTASSSDLWNPDDLAQPPRVELDSEGVRLVKGGAWVFCVGIPLSGEHSARAWVGEPDGDAVRALAYRIAALPLLAKGDHQGGADPARFHPGLQAIWRLELVTYVARGRGDGKADEYALGSMQRAVDAVCRLESLVASQSLGRAQFVARSEFWRERPPSSKESPDVSSSGGPADYAELRLTYAALAPPAFKGVDTVGSKCGWKRAGAQSAE